MPSTNTPVPLALNASPMPRDLFYCGGNVALGFPTCESWFLIEFCGAQLEWSIAETLARLDEFSEAAKARILHDCAVHRKYSVAAHG